MVHGMQTHCPALECDTNYSSPVALKISVDDANSAESDLLLMTVLE